MPKQLVCISCDLNGLKVTNDTLGHLAGDELIKGAAECLSKHFPDICRTGGDEFVAMLAISRDEYEKIRRELNSTIANWHGKLVPELSISIGSASSEEFPDFSLEELTKTADEKSINS